MLGISRSSPVYQWRVCCSVGCWRSPTCTLCSTMAPVPTTPRLQGASGPAQLALTAFIGCVTASICYRVTRWRFAPALSSRTPSILGLTVSRGAAIALGLALMWPALRFVFSGRDGQALGAAALAARHDRVRRLAIIVAILVRRLLARDDTGRISRVKASSTTRRAGAPRHGTSSTPSRSNRRSSAMGWCAGRSPRSPRRDFSRSTTSTCVCSSRVDTSGAASCSLAIIFVIGSCIRRAPLVDPPRPADVAIGFAVLSYTDNTLTSCNLQVPFCLVFGILAGASAQALARHGEAPSGGAIAAGTTCSDRGVRLSASCSSTNSSIRGRVRRRRSYRRAGCSWRGATR